MFDESFESIVESLQEQLQTKYEMGYVKGKREAEEALIKNGAIIRIETKVAYPELVDIPLQSKETIMVSDSILIRNTSETTVYLGIPKGYDLVITGSKE